MSVNVYACNSWYFEYESLCVRMKESEVITNHTFYVDRYTIIIIIIIGMVDDSTANSTRRNGTCHFL